MNQISNKLNTEDIFSLGFNKFLLKEILDVPQLVNPRNTSGEIANAMRWQDFKPVPSVNGGIAPNYTNQFINKYTIINDTCFFVLNWYNSTGGIAGNGGNPLFFNLPAKPNVKWHNEIQLGTGSFYNAPSGGYVFVLFNASEKKAYFKNMFDDTIVKGSDQNESDRFIKITGFYEVG